MKSLLNTATGQELAVLVEVLQRLVEAGADGRDQRVFFRRQVVQVLVGRVARVDLVLDAVQAIIISAAKHMYGLARGSGKRVSMRRAFGLAT